MADSQSYYSGLLTTIDAKISGLITNPQVDYKVGDISVSASQKLEQLMTLREQIIKRMVEKPYEVIETMQDGVNLFGQDYGRYVNEENHS